ncbi:DNA-binding protein [Embleya sp. NPDC059237]|uniref:DNA-binding protein n=1 Tax=Embleya sp. NPDC059237 TaxID=3346784 RepID=UPI0036B95959
MSLEQYLVDDKAAAAWTGRPASTIRRWGLEGRITKHGNGRGAVRYDLRELQPRTAANGPMKAPPLPEQLATAA